MLIIQSEDMRDIETLRTVCGAVSACCARNCTCILAGRIKMCCSQQSCQIIIRYLLLFIEEFYVLEQYTEIMQARYPDMIEVQFGEDDSFSDIYLPRMLIQPIVENAVNYGIRDIDWEGHIDLKVYKENGYQRAVREYSGRHIYKRTLDICKMAGDSGTVFHAGAA